jgi:hypothetical protein
MLLRNKRTGFVYAYSQALVNDPEFEIYTEEAPVVSPKQKEVVVVRKPKVRKNGNSLQQNHQ